jgi:hypothetical protein
MNEQLLERPEPNRLAGTIDERTRILRNAETAIFRRQERFWKEVRKRIAERNPAVRGVLQRLY